MYRSSRGYSKYRFFLALQLDKEKKLSTMVFMFKQLHTHSQLGTPQSNHSLAFGYKDLTTKTPNPPLRLLEGEFARIYYW